MGALSALVPLGVWYFFSPEFTDVGYQPVQPVPFSHALHAGEMSMDCRYCHATVERADVAMVPPTQTCMNCHQLVGRDKETLALVRDSAANGEPISWIRVHEVPDYAYFPHRSHISAGVGCSTCHGDIRSMERVRQVEPLSMGWCLDCHRSPEGALREPSEITNTVWVPPPDQAQRGARLREERMLAPPVDCSGCHR